MTRREVESSLLSKGFREGRSNHHKHLVYFDEAGKKTPIRTRVSHGSKKDFAPPIISRMASQCRLTTPEFRELVNCLMSRQD